MLEPHIRPVRSATVAFTLVLAACGRTDKTPASDSFRAAAPGTQSTLVGAARTARVYPGALTKPIDAYTGDEFFALTNGLKYAGSHERQRKCKDSSDCEGTAPKRKTLVQVSAVATQDSVSAGDVPEFGVVYVRAINRGDAEEARYGMRPGKSLRYYAIVQRDSTGGLRWRLEELETSVPRRHAQIAAGRVNGCGHPWRAGARADFRSCAQGDRTDTVTTLPLALQVALDDPIWTMCEIGCCELAR